MKKLLFSILFSFVLTFGAISNAEASEGIVELGNVNDTDARCYAVSGLTDRSSDYQILVQCRNLVYPIDGGTYYILWADPIAKDEKETKPLRIGDIGFGKELFRTRSPFERLFITGEQTKSPRQPSNSIIMEGQVENIEFLENEPTPTLTPEPTKKPSPKITSKVTPAPQQKGGGASSVVFIIVLVITIIFVIAIIIFVVNKIRNS